MSRSAFFQHFKDITAMSPVQYQKKLRLLEARRLMVDEDETAEGSSFRVGYGSASQFSREYVRMFGESPRRDTSKIKRVGRRLREL
jgi:AraC-like DNA-binding protein